MAPKAVWYKQPEGGEAYVKFSTAYCEKYEEQFVKKSGIGKVMVRDYEVDFKKMERTAPDGTVEKLKREGTPLPKVEAGVYQFSASKTKWIDVDSNLQKKIAVMKAQGKLVFSWYHEEFDTTYKIDLAQMTQKNTDSGTVRNLRCLAGKSAGRGGDEESDEDEEESDESPPAKKSGQKAGKKKKKSEMSDGDDDDDDDDEPPKKKSKAETGVAKSSKPDGAEKKKPTTTKLIKKGRGVVDPMSCKVDTCHVHEAGPDVYQCTLNQTNLLNSNNNKFYIIQLLESDANNAWWLFTRWGRVGVPGSTQLKPMASLEAAKTAFATQFRSKTGNTWNTRDNFTKLEGKYQLMDMVLGKEDDKAASDDSDGAGAEDTKVQSKLPKAVQQVMSLISDTKAMVTAMKELEVDTEKMPLGKVSKKQIREALKHLRTIETELKKPKPSQSTLANESSMFYTLIPHNVGMKKLDIIRDNKTIAEKRNLLDMLSDLEIADKILKQAKKAKVHPLDAAYEGMHCKLQPLKASSEEFERVKTYVANTHGKTHTAYKLEVMDVFEVEREGEAKRYEYYSNSTNRTLLWHGSRKANWMGILSQGLRIAPPEAPVTGYMFGKGVYFADVATKSGNYCHTSRDDNIGLMTLNEVAMGNPVKLTQAKYMDKPPKGHNSTMGVGKNEPVSSITDEDGVIWPMGKMGNSDVTKTDLLYNEYIVYDVAQIKARYLVKLKFNYDKK